MSFFDYALTQIIEKDNLNKLLQAKSYSFDEDVSDEEEEGLIMEKSYSSIELKNSAWARITLLIIAIVGFTIWDK